MQELQTIFQRHGGRITSISMSTDRVEEQRAVDNIQFACVYPRDKKVTLRQEMSEKFEIDINDIIFSPRGMLLFVLITLHQIHNN